MAITTVDLAMAGAQPVRMIAKGVTATLVAGRPASLWALGGIPGAGAFNATLNGVTLSSTAGLVAGQIPHIDPVSGETRLMRLSASAAQPGGLWLMDRIWHNGGFTITSTAAQAIVSPAWPARDVNGSANGVGVQLAVEVSVATGAGVPTITISYTNQDNVAGRTATNIVATVATSAIGATYLIGLQAGDTGVRSVQSLTLSATWTSGTIHLVAYRPIVNLEMPQANVTYAADFLSGGNPNIYNGTVPWLVFVPSTTTAISLIGSYTETQG